MRRHGYTPPETPDAPLFEPRENLMRHGDENGLVYVNGKARPAAVTSQKRTTFRDRLADYFKDRPGVWIGGLQLAEIAGAYAWRTRVSNCRTELGMTIENRIRVLDNGIKVSEYRYVQG